jgi:hypothetical protein
MRVTPAGFILSIGVMILLFGGLTTEYWAGDTAFEQWLKTPTGRLVVLSVALGAGFLVERLLIMAGIRLIVLREPR